MMEPAHTTDRIVDLRDDMARRIARSGKAANGDGDAAVFRRVTLPLAGVDPLAWLNLQPSPVKVYWGSRDRALEAAGIGAAHRFTAAGTAEADRALAGVARCLERSEAGLRCYGGMRFYEPLDGDASWRRFPPGLFIVPQFELIREGADACLVCNLPAAAGETEIEGILASLNDMVFDLALPENPFPAPRARRDTPDRAGWTRNVDRALAALAGGDLEKIVLARRTDLAFDHPISPVALLRRLKTVTPDCFHFCLQLDAETAFVGASPERLYRRAGRDLESEAVAGTRPRGSTMAGDRELGRALQESDKDRREHLFVSDAIRTALEPAAAALTVEPDVRLLKLARGQHLFTGVRAVLADGVGDPELLARLHPTPAVGGCPTGAAVARMREWEGFDRGWYAAPVGWVGRDGAEFAVGIRSALVRGAGLSLFSGAGIVAGSTPDSEWEEIENKIEDFIRILTGIPHPA